MIHSDVFRRMRYAYLQGYGTLTSIAALRRSFQNMDIPAMQYYPITSCYITTQQIKMYFERTLRLSERFCHYAFNTVGIIIRSDIYRGKTNSI